MRNWEAATITLPESADFRGCSPAARNFPWLLLPVPLGPRSKSMDTAIGVSLLPTADSAPVMLASCRLVTRMKKKIKSTTVPATVFASCRSKSNRKISTCTSFHLLNPLQLWISLIHTFPGLSVLPIPLPFILLVTSLKQSEIIDLLEEAAPLI